MSDQQPNGRPHAPSWAQQPTPPLPQPAPPSQWGQQPTGPQWAPPQPPPPKKNRGLKIALGVVGGIVVISVIAALASSGGKSKTTTADKVTAPATTAPATTNGATKTATPAAKPRTAHVGDTITVHGMDDGSKLAITLVKWVDPAKGGDEYTTPGKGMRFVAAQIRITNSGTAVYDDSPGNGLQVADVDGQRFQASPWDVSAGPSMASSLKLANGDKALGYIAFEVPKGSKIASLQFTADSGFADETGEWKIP